MLESPTGKGVEAVMYNIQSDTLKVVNSINGALVDVILESIAEDYQLLLCNFNFASIMFIRRVDAHNLVRLGKNYG